jgi:hypothetical protein
MRGVKTWLTTTLFDGSKETTEASGSAQKIVDIRGELQIDINISVDFGESFFNLRVGVRPVPSTDTREE